MLVGHDSLVGAPVRPSPGLMGSHLVSRGRLTCHS